jgi:3-hydroxyacyl-[acyl-carrier-protein] dehydratase
MSFEQIYQAIPHRPPFLFVDAIDELTETRIRTTKRIHGHEPFFQGHYPDYPIMPGVLVCESIFQSGAILISKRMDSSSLHGIPVLTRIQDARFRNMVRPDDILEIEVEIAEVISNAYFLKGKAKVSGKTAVTVAFACSLMNEAEKSS